MILLNYHIGKKELGVIVIYDCFSFFNELDILEIRLEELYPVVDKFVIVESNKSFKGNEKEFIFYNNRNRFLKYKDKIKYLQYRMPDSNLSLIDEWNQKNSLLNGLRECKDDDIILFSDVDEFPRRKDLIKAVEIFNNYESITFDVRRYNYNLNGLCVENDKMTVCYGTRMFRYNLCKKIPHLVRLRNDRIREDSLQYHMKDSGWHFTYIGDIKTIREKITNWTHWGEFIDKNSEEYIIERIQNNIHLNNETPGKIIWTNIDDSFPEDVKNNMNKYSHIIKKV